MQKFFSALQKAKSMISLKVNHSADHKFNFKAVQIQRICSVTKKINQLINKLNQILFTIIMS